MIDGLWRVVNENLGFLNEKALSGPMRCGVSPLLLSGPPSWAERGTELRLSPMNDSSLE